MFVKENPNIKKTFRGQGYNGVGGMVGKVNGLSGIVLQSNKLVLYTHCHSQKSNLVVSSLARIIGFRNVMDVIKASHIFLIYLLKGKNI